MNDIRNKIATKFE